MGKSRIKHPIKKIVSHRSSDKYDRSIANRRLRHIIKHNLNQGIDFFPILKEISDVWNFNSDGGGYYWKDLEEKYKRK